jgi:hypothetical protein
MPDATPPAVITFPSLTMRAFSKVAPTSVSRSAYAQWVVARRPSSSPVTPSTNAPVQTESNVSNAGRLLAYEINCLKIGHDADDTTAARNADKIQLTAILECRGRQ